jgi:hypothetical protein
MGVDVLGWIQSVTPPDFDLPRKENPRKKQSDTNQTYSVRSAYCGPCMVRTPEIRLAHSCGSLANCPDDHFKEKKTRKVEQADQSTLKTHIDQFKQREQKRSDQRKKDKKAEQRIIDLLTVKAALSVLRESGWYWGNISSDKAKELLKSSSPGTFLVRDSSDRRYLFSMSVMTRSGPTSIRLIFSRGCFRVETSTGLISPRSPCVVSLVLRMSHLSRNSNGIQEEEDSRPIVPKPFRSNLLEKPLYSKVPSLKHFSRLVINRYNLRNFTQQRDTEYIRAYPYPI